MVKEGGGDREIRGRKKEKESKWELFEKRKKLKSMDFSIGKKVESGRQISTAEYAP